MADQQRIASMKLALAGLSADTGIKFPAELSGGMIKRAAFARALALDPRILFLDEPTSDLDPLTASGIDALVVELNRNLGITVVIVTHDLTTLVTVCGRIAVLVDGKISVGTIDELMNANVITTLEYARDLSGTTTAAQFVELSSTQARKQYELILKQTGALKSLAKTITKSIAE